MKKGGLEEFGAYRKSLELFDLVVEDMETLKGDYSLGRLVSQQLASADSICANIEEGYGRLSRKEYIRFLDFARGSARETYGRYKRMKHWLSEDVVQQRTELLDEIIGILTATITTLGNEKGSRVAGRGRVREDTPSYGSDTMSEPLDT
jgi:four helix bundle protein